MRYGPELTRPGVTKVRFRCTPRPTARRERTTINLSSSISNNPNVSGATAPSISELRGKLPSACWVRSNRNRTMARALVTSPSASSPVKVS